MKRSTMISTLALLLAGSGHPVQAQGRLMLAQFGADPLAGGWTSFDLYPRAVGDVNGDGKMDAVGFAKDGVYVAISTGRQFRPATRWITQFGTIAGGWTSFGQYPRIMGDVNGDGKADIVGFANDGIYVSLSTGVAFAPVSKWRADDFSLVLGWTSYSVYPRFVGDVNGDGKADVIGVASDGVYVSISNGVAFNAPHKWSASFAPPNWTDYNTYPRAVADVNADGKADFIGFAGDGVYVALSTGQTFGPQTQWSGHYGTLAGGWANFDRFPRFVVDVNGDRRADVVGFAADGTYVSLSSPVAGASPEFFDEPSKWNDQFCVASAGGGWTSESVVPRVMGDFDGDGKADVIGFAYQGVYGAASNGTAFVLPPETLPLDTTGMLDLTLGTVQQMSGEILADQQGLATESIENTLETTTQEAAYVVQSFGHVIVGELSPYEAGSYEKIRAEIDWMMTQQALGKELPDLPLDIITNWYNTIIYPSMH